MINGQGNLYNVNSDSVATDTQTYRFACFSNHFDDLNIFSGLE